MLKSDIRKDILLKRDALALDFRLEAALNLSAHWPENLKPRVVAGFLPIKSEIDVRPLMSFLSSRGARLALPIITDGALIFRELTKETKLVKGSFGTMWPDENSLEVIPDLLLIPLAAFDTAGNRIGYGQGHYDRTLQNLQAVKVGVAFSCQKVQQINAEPHDVKLDFVLTEQDMLMCGNNAMAYVR